MVNAPTISDLLNSNASTRAALDIAMWHIRKTQRPAQSKTILDLLRKVQREARCLNERAYDLMIAGAACPPVAPVAVPGEAQPTPDRRCDDQIVVVESVYPLK